MYQLITYHAGFGAFSYSPFCTKAAWLLNSADVAWKREDADDPRKFARGKLPVLRVGNRLIHDSDNIRQFLESGGADFWGDVSPRDRAHGHALIRMAEEHMYFYTAIDRWMNDAVWPHIRAAYFSGMPPIVRTLISGKLRKDLRWALTHRGMLRLSEDERTAMLEADLQTVTTLLDGQDFLLGAAPSLPDYSVAAMLDGMQAGPVETAQVKRVRGDAVLMAYVDRMKEACG